MRSHRLQGKVAVVTGVSRGLGQYLSMAWAREGARVVLVARDGERTSTLSSATCPNRGGST